MCRYMRYEPGEVRCCCTTAVGLSVYILDGRLVNSEKMWIGIVRIVFNMAHTHRHTNAEHHRSWPSQRGYFKLLLL